jgi:hypothetical protein
MQDDVGAKDGLLSFLGCRLFCCKSHGVLSFLARLTEGSFSLQNQEVEVTLKSNVIVAGIVVSALKFFQKVRTFRIIMLDDFGSKDAFQLGGFGYKVEYRSSNGQLETQPFPPENLCPRGQFN